LLACLPAPLSGLLITERTPLLLLTDGLVVLQDIFEPTVTQVPPGFLGQIVVYKSGKAKIKLGDTLFDVPLTHSHSLSKGRPSTAHSSIDWPALLPFEQIVPGADCGFLQEAAYISKDQVRAQKW